MSTLDELINLSKKEYENSKDFHESIKTFAAKIKAGELHIMTKHSHDLLVAQSEKLQALESAGVDNWSGYEYAMELLNEKNEEI